MKKNEEDEEEEDAEVEEAEAEANQKKKRNKIRRRRTQKQHIGSLRRSTANRILNIDDDDIFRMKRKLTHISLF